MNNTTPTVDDMRRLIARHLELSLVMVDEDDRLHEDLQMDSLELYGVLADAETMYGALPEPGTVHNHTTVAELHAVMLQARAGQ